MSTKSKSQSSAMSNKTPVEKDDIQASKVSTKEKGFIKSLGRKFKKCVRFFTPKKSEKTDTKELGIPVKLDETAVPSPVEPYIPHSNQCDATVGQNNSSPLASIVKEKDIDEPELVKILPPKKHSLLRRHSLPNPLALSLVDATKHEIKPSVEQLLHIEPAATIPPLMSAKTNENSVLPVNIVTTPKEKKEKIVGATTAVAESRTNKPEKVKESVWTKLNPFHKKKKKEVVLTSYKRSPEEEVVLTSYKRLPEEDKDQVQEQAPDSGSFKKVTNDVSFFSKLDPRRYKTRKYSVTADPSLGDQNGVLLFIANHLVALVIIVLVIISLPFTWLAIILERKRIQEFFDKLDDE